MIEKIKSLRSELESAVAEDAAAVETLRIKYLSKKGAISALMNDFRNVAPSRSANSARPSTNSRHMPPNASTHSAKLPNAAMTNAASST